MVQSTADVDGTLILASSYTQSLKKKNSVHTEHPVKFCEQRNESVMISNDHYPLMIINASMNMYQ